MSKSDCRRINIDLRVLLKRVKVKEEEEKEKGYAESAPRYSKTNGNHVITIEDNLQLPIVVVCKGCDCALRCLAGKRITLTDAIIMQKGENKCRCFHRKNLIRFYYFHICCVSFDIRRRMLVGHNYNYNHTPYVANGMFSITAIKQYLDALNSNITALNLSEARIKEFTDKFEKNNVHGGSDVIMFV